MLEEQIPVIMAHPVTELPISNWIEVGFILLTRSLMSEIGFSNFWGSCLPLGTPRSLNLEDLPQVIRRQF